ncbi:MAG TPA: serine O-acetyltransferase EpsC [Blastocatellia bacterium]|nr:serine O-acetyltransferase EpsC [Blastocatellia bacterium]
MEKLNIAARQNRLAKIMERIAASYDEATPKIHHLDRMPLPSREDAAAIMRAIEEVIYPGYYSAGGVTHQGIIYRVQERTGWLFEHLCDQISKSFCHMKELDGEMAHVPDDLAEECAYAFLESLPALRRMLAKDIQAAYDGDPAARCIDEIILSYPAAYAITAYRTAHELHRMGVPLLPRMLTELAHSRTGIDIHPGAEIGESFFIDHGTGVVIGETTIIGNNVKLYQGVTLGALSFAKDEKGRLIRGQKRHPTIEDNVVIYAGATILGGDTVIGEGSIIGGNVWLTESVPPRTRVVQAEPKPRFLAPDEQLQGV